MMSGPDNCLSTFAGAPKDFPAAARPPVDAPFLTLFRESEKGVSPLALEGIRSAGRHDFAEPGPRLPTADTTPNSIEAPYRGATVSRASTSSRDRIRLGADGVPSSASAANESTMIAVAVHCSLAGARRFPMVDGYSAQSRPVARSHVRNGGSPWGRMETHLRRPRQRGIARELKIAGRNARGKKRRRG